MGAIWPFSFFRRNPSIAGIGFREVRRGADRRRFIWIHGNEQTAFEVLTKHFADGAQGRGFFIRNGAERNAPLLGGKLDPNRMFSRVGAERSLRSLNPSWTAEQVSRALRELDEDRDGFVRRILPRDAGLLVALHNNGPAYSVDDELAISDAVALGDKAHPDEFMLCTARTDFEFLAGGSFNVLLQHKAPLEDDGSLSRLCAARGVRYVNIEAGLGNAAAQQRMLAWVEAVLP
jgi:hypothetical protein